MSTVILLRQWGRWGSILSGYPHMSPMFGERSLKTPLYGIGYIPPDVMDIERAVCQVEPEQRRIIIQRYQWSLSLAGIAAIWTVSKWVARRRLEDAEGAVHHEYCNLGTNLVKASTVEKLSLRPA